MKARTSEELLLLLSYLSLIGIWFAIPSVSLMINRDKRWPYALGLLSICVIFLMVSYFAQWEVLFPRSASEAPELYTLADYDKVRQCKCKGYIPLDE